HAVEGRDGVAGASTSEARQGDDDAQDQKGRSLAHGSHLSYFGEAVIVGGRRTGPKSARQTSKSLGSFERGRDARANVARREANRRGRGDWARGARRRAARGRTG